MHACGWCGSIRDLLQADPSTIQQALAEFVTSRLALPVDRGQEEAWNASLKLLHREFDELAATIPDAMKWALVLEYTLPRERGRRPDAVLLVPGAVIVLEFKGTATPLRADLDQVRAYARDLASYHAPSHGQDVLPILVCTSSRQQPALISDTSVVGREGLATVIREFVVNRTGSAVPLQTWVEGNYAPLPSLIAAARSIFRHEPLPRIRRAASAGVGRAIERLQAIATAAREHHLVLVTGVPGAGKTLVGLQFVYASRFSDDEAARPAVFLSGKGPLVKVLQHALKSSVFVQGVHDFLLDHGGPTHRHTPEEHIWVYDEAQRAWDAERVRSKRGHGASEPEDFVRLGLRMPRWAMLVGLFGEGQEIHLGEEAGLGQWNDAVRASGARWIVHCPARLAPLFADAEVRVADELDLPTTPRAHLAADMHAWVGRLLEGDLKAAAALAEGIQAAGFNLYLTQDLDAARAYARRRYAGQEDVRYGLLGSSKARILGAYGMDTSFGTTRFFREGPWYNDEPASPRSCSQLQEVATEFACQGLELDLPIVGWGEDLVWDGQGWRSAPSPRSQAKDLHRLRLNSYRVLLTRGRDGMVIFVPPDARLSSTLEALRVAGVAALE
jgi:DUF2075 family protein